MPQGANTIGFGRRGSLDLSSGSGQGAGGARLTVARNLCTNPSFNTGRTDYYLGSNTHPDFNSRLSVLNARTVTPKGLAVQDTALLGSSCMLVGGLVYTRDYTWDMEQANAVSGGASQTGWYRVGVNDVYTPQQGSPQSGTYCVSVKNTAGGTTALSQNSGSQGGSICWYGRNYTATAWVKTSGTARVATLSMVFDDGMGNPPIQTTTATVTDSTTWQQITVTGTAPAGAVRVYLTVSWASTAANEVHFLDNVRLYDTAAVANGVAPVGGVTNTRFGAQDATDDSYLTYYFYAQPNTAYTFSGYMRHSPQLVLDELASEDLPNIHVFNNYALRLYDPNNTTDFPTSATTIGTTLTGHELDAWQRHAVTYTTGDVVDRPIEMRFYGNRVWETDLYATQSAYMLAPLTPKYPWSYTDYLAWNPVLLNIPPYDWNGWDFGSFWDGIQIEEGTAATAYIDGTQRGCEWVDASDDPGLVANSNNGPYGGTLNWSANSSTGDAVRTIPSVGLVDPTVNDGTWNAWGEYRDTGYSSSFPSSVSGLSGGITVGSGAYAAQLAAPANGARTRSALVFDYHNAGANQCFGGSEPTPTTVDSWHGTLSFYARWISGDPAIVVALEDAAGTNLILSKAITLETLDGTRGDWRRYRIDFATAGNGFIDTSNSKIVFRQANPTAAATFQVSGIVVDNQPYAAGVALDPVRDAKYLPGWPVNHEVANLNGSNEKPGFSRGSEFEYYTGLTTISARVSGSAQGSDDVFVGLPSFAGIIERSTINLSTITRSLLYGIAGREWRDIRFADDLFSGPSFSNVQLGGQGGTQHITFMGDPLLTGSTGFGVHEIANTGKYETYLRLKDSYGTFGLWRDGAHAQDDRNDSGIQFATFQDGTTAFYSTFGGGAGADCEISLSNGGTTTLRGVLAMVNTAGHYHANTLAGDMVLRADTSAGTPDQGVTLAVGTAGVFLRLGNTNVGASSGPGIILGNSGTTQGKIGLHTGDGSHSGYIDFYSWAGNRQGYIGWSTTNAAADAGTVEYKSGLHLFTGNMQISAPGTAGGALLNLHDSTNNTSKYLRCQGAGGLFEMINSGYTTAILSVSDTGVLNHQVSWPVPQMVSGTTSVTIALNAGSGNASASFGKTFSAAPNVTQTQSSLPGNTGNWIAKHIAATTTACTLYAYTATGTQGVAATAAMDWIAVN